MKLITSRDNPFYKELLKLSSSSKARREAKLTFLDGAHLLAAYLDSGLLPAHIMLNAAALNDDEIRALLARMDGVPLTQLDDKLYAELTELKTPSGVLALVQIPQATSQDAHFALLLDDIQDPGNLGSILRSAAAAGCDAVFLSIGSADVWSPRVLRAAMGGHLCLHIHERQDLLAVAQAYKGKTYATSLQAQRSLYDCDFQGDIAFMVGNEGAGLSPALLTLATQPITIPMLGRVESLNAAAATAICLFEALRQRL